MEFTQVYSVKVTTDELLKALQVLDPDIFLGHNVTDVDEVYMSEKEAKTLIISFKEEVKS